MAHRNAPLTPEGCWRLCERVDALLDSGTLVTFAHGRVANHVLPVPDLDQVVALVEGYAIRADGTLWKLDRSVDYSPDGFGWEVHPQRVGGLPPITQFAVSRDQDAFYALTPDGDLWAWGDNSSGQLGLEKRRTVRTPTRVDGITNIVNLAASYTSAFALHEDGRVLGWGSNPTLAPCKAPERHVPQTTGGLGPIKSLRGGHNTVYPIT